MRGEAWFRTDDAKRTIEWGAEEDNDYSGTLVVQENGSGSTVVLTLHTPREHEGIEESIDQVLERIDAKHRRPYYAGRPASASTATGQLSKHLYEQKTLVEAALAGGASS